MTLMGLDELLEQTVRAIYKQWYDVAIEMHHADIDAERHALAAALQDMGDSEAEIQAAEDRILEFLDWLGQRPEVQAVAGDLLSRVPQFRTSLLRLRQPDGASVRGPVVKKTDLAAARRALLIALLGAPDPAAYVLATMHYHDHTPIRFGPSGMEMGENELLRTLNSVLEQVEIHWHQLSLADQERVQVEVARLEAAMGDEAAAGNIDQADVDKALILQVLEALETVPDVLRVALAEFVAGKRDDPPETFRSGGSTRNISLGEQFVNTVRSLRNASMGSALESMIEFTPPTAGVVPSETVVAETAVDFVSNVDFPGEVPPGIEIPLVVHLSLHAEDDAVDHDVSVTFADPKQPEILEVVLSAPDFQERTGNWTRLIKVFSDRDSQPAVFLLSAKEISGVTSLTVDYNHGGRLLGSAKYEVTITEQPAAEPAPLRRIGAATPIEPLPADPPPPADLELRVTKDERSNTLHFTLHSEDASLGYIRQEMGSVQLADEPRRFLAEKLARLSDFAGRAMDHQDDAFLREVEDEIIAIGENLFEQIFPQALRDEYWRIKALREEGRIRSLLIVSDEPWIPWELIKPYGFDNETNMELSDDFLAAAFQTSRWLAGRGLGEPMHIRAAELVAPELDLVYVQREQAYFANLAERGLRLGEILRTRSDFLETTRNGEFQLMHVAAHGKFKPENADTSPIILRNREIVQPDDLAGGRSLALRRQRPLIFLNTCHSGQLEFTLTGLGGWADRMVNDIGVSAFIGTLWEVQDALAAEFAQMFYNKLIEGQTLGEAFHSAREHIRALQPANPTWLAYTLYADPNSRAEWAFAEE